MISVIVCTYNGEKYIEEQIQSLFIQSKQADEIYFFDDCSNDNTVKIIKLFIKKNQLESKWFVIKNKKNIGYAQNFREGLSRLKGDIILFCDQDDIWEADKIKKTVNILNDNPNISVIGTDLVHFYPNSSEKKEGSFDGSCEIVSYTGGLFSFIHHPAGCTMGIKRDYYNRIKSYYTDTWSHDEFFWRFATIDGCAICLHDSLMKHRISGNNVTSQKKFDLEKRKKQAFKNKVNYQQLLEYCEQKKIDNNTLDCIRYFQKGNELRYIFLSTSSITRVYSLLKYRKIYFSIKQFLGDIYYGYVKVNIKKWLF